jgi:hypothetical protein
LHYGSLRYLTALFVLACAGCVSLQQVEGQVAIRPAGARTITLLAPVQPYAKRHLDYARLSFVAYEVTDGGIAAEKKAKDGRRQSGDCPDPEDQLKSARWVRWEDFPSGEALEKIRDFHLRVEVWQKEAPAEVVVAFGGAIFNNRNDWLANLRWFIPFHDDQYTQVVKTFLPAFVTEFKRRRGQSGSTEQQPLLIATGHSLGGGLAQQFAYALPVDQEVPRVSAVYAFHPSPVTGYFSVNKAIRLENAKDLVIERIYERSEILALLRSIQNVFFKPSEKDPAVTGYRYSIVPSAGPIENHSLGVFTCNLAVKARKESK